MQDALEVVVEVAEGDGRVGAVRGAGLSPRAAVVGNSVVSFNEGMSSQDREDIYLSNLYAQLATRSAQ